MSPIKLQRSSATFVAFLFVAFYQEIGAEVLVLTKILVIAALLWWWLGGGIIKDEK